MYDHIPTALKNQIVHIWRDTIGQGYSSEYYVDYAYSSMVNTLQREYGVFRLSKNKYNRDGEEFINFFLEEEDFEKALDAIELSFTLIDEKTRSFDYLRRRDSNHRATEAIKELNSRFKEHGIGYQYVSGEILRTDSELLHDQVVKPALRLLNGDKYAGAQEEFLTAHEHYRHGNEKEALNECLKAFESMMKGICDKRNWTYKPNGTAKDLIDVCLQNGLIPAFWQQSFTSLRSLLESSIPTGRNKLGGHGQGANTVDVPPYLVGYMLHMTASALVFLGEAEAALPK